MIRRPPRSKLSDTLVHYTTLVRSIAGVDRQWIGRLIVLLHLAEEDLLEICHFGLWNLSHRRFDVAVISLGVDFLHGLNLGDLLLSGSRFGRFAVEIGRAHV